MKILAIVFILGISMIIALSVAAKLAATLEINDREIFFKHSGRRARDVQREHYLKYGKLTSDYDSSRTLELLQEEEK